jgi:DNA-binding transcriptional LysR family regulator
MNKQWLETYLCVCETNSVSKAADILFLTQPSVSSRIQALEREIGEPLFMRVGKRMILNEAGKMFHPFALSILNEWSKSQKAISDLKQSVKGNLTVAMFYAVIPLFVPHLISFNRKYPDVRLAVKTLHSDEIIGGYIQSNIAQVGIVRETDDPLFDRSPLMMDNFLLTVYPDHPFAVKGGFTPQELLDEPFIYLNSGEFYKETVGKILKTKEMEQRIVLETDNTEVCKRYIQEKLGIAYMPKFAIENELQAGTLVAFETEDRRALVDRSIDMIWMKDHSNHIVPVFVGHILEHFHHS